MQVSIMKPAPACRSKRFSNLRGLDDRARLQELLRGEVGFGLASGPAKGNPEITPANGPPSRCVMLLVVVPKLLDVVMGEGLEPALLVESA
jgi:hypothetical protein